MKVVIDTNVLLTSISTKSPNHAIFQAIVKGELELCVTTDILLEYEEIFLQQTNPSITSFVMRTINELPHTQLITKYYFWFLINADPDDNKFVDCAVAANADYLITNDKHFKVLKNISFPKVNVVNGIDFCEKYF
jgi:uncharacterized protein